MANETTTAPVAAQNPSSTAAASTTATPPAAAQAPAQAQEHTGGHGDTWNPKMPEPQIINGVKVYPTSYIPAKAELHYPKKMLVEMKEWHIEAIHIAVFFLVLIFLYIGSWKRPNHR